MIQEPICYISVAIRIAYFWFIWEFLYSAGRR